MYNKQLTFAREYRGYSQTDLANAIPGLAQSNLSKFEKGLCVLSNEVLVKIFDFLDFPISFLDKRINIQIENANYRRRLSVNKTDINKFESQVIMLASIIDEFSEVIDWPQFKLTQFDLENNFNVEYVANYTRKLLKIPTGDPVRNIFNLLESNGIITIEIDAHSKFDGVSFVTEKGIPVIIINKSFSNDRKRFTLAHELGHILMHINNPISDIRDKEFEANCFASEFLMPANDIKDYLLNLKLLGLRELKQYWLTSMAAIVRRAKDLKLIDENRYKYFLIEMSRSGYSKNEPFPVYIDSPAVFINAYKMIKDELHYSDKDFSDMLRLPNDFIKEIFDNKIFKLKVLV